MLPKASALRGALVARSYVQASTLNISTCSKEDDRQAVGPRHSPFEIRPEKFKIHQTTQPLERVALGRKLLQTLLDIEEPGLAPHPTPRSRSGPRNHDPEERARRFLEMRSLGVSWPILGRLPFKGALPMLNQPLFAALDVSLETTTICLRRTDMPPTSLSNPRRASPVSASRPRAEHLAKSGCRPTWPSHAPLSLPVCRRL